MGTPVSRMIINRHTFIDINSLIRWDLDGDEAWGEDQDMWPVTRSPTANARPAPDEPNRTTGAPPSGGRWARSAAGQ